MSTKIKPSALAQWNSPATQKWKGIAIEQAASLKQLAAELHYLLTKERFTKNGTRTLAEIASRMLYFSRIPTRPYDLHHWIIRDESEPTNWDGLILVSDGTRIVLTQNRDLDYVPFTIDNNTRGEFKATYWQPVHPPSRKK